MINQVSPILITNRLSIGSIKSHAHSVIPIALAIILELGSQKIVSKSGLPPGHRIENFPFIMGMSALAESYRCDTFFGRFVFGSFVVLASIIFQVFSQVVRLKEQIEKQKKQIEKQKVRIGRQNEQIKGKEGKLKGQEAEITKFSKRITEQCQTIRDQKDAISLLKSGRLPLKK